MRPVNLLPDDQRPHRGGGRPGSAYVVVGLLAVALAATLAYVLTVDDIRSKRDEIARVEAEAQAAEQRAQALAPYAAFASMRQERVASVTALAQSRIDWERLMRELARVLPAGSYVTSVDASASPPSAGAAAPTGPTLKLNGCARGHRDVATLLVRLRKLHRADDVKLRESTRAGAGGGGCARGTSFTAEVLFTPTAPREAPRGHVRVPASLGGGS